MQLGSVWPGSLLLFILFYLFIFAMLGIKPRVPGTLGKHSHRAIPSLSMFFPFLFLTEFNSRTYSNHLTTVKIKSTTQDDRT